MSTDEHDISDETELSREVSSDATDEKAQKENQNNGLAYQQKLAIHKRDQYLCTSCRESTDDPNELDVDHVVPRGKGGSNVPQNKTSLCRRCHEAKHDERDHAPTVRFISTGDMQQKDFIWFRHLWNDLFPALTEAAIGHRIEPKFNLASSASYDAWHLPLGDLRKADDMLADRDDIRYHSLRANHWM